MGGIYEGGICPEICPTSGKSKKKKKKTPPGRRRPPPPPLPRRPPSPLPPAPVPFSPPLPSSPAPPPPRIRIRPGELSHLLPSWSRHRHRHRHRHLRRRHRGSGDDGPRPQQPPPQQPPPQPPPQPAGTVPPRGSGRGHFRSGWEDTPPEPRRGRRVVRGLGIPTGSSWVGGWVGGGLRGVCFVGRPKMFGLDTGRGGGAYAYSTS